MSSCLSAPMEIMSEHRNRQGYEANDQTVLQTQSSERGHNALSGRVGRSYRSSLAFRPTPARRTLVRHVSTHRDDLPGRGATPLIDARADAACLPEPMPAPMPAPMPVPMPAPIAVPIPPGRLSLGAPDLARRSAALALALARALVLVLAEWLSARPVDPQCALPASPPSQSLRAQRFGPVRAEAARGSTSLPDRARLSDHARDRTALLAEGVLERPQRHPKALREGFPGESGRVEAASNEGHSGVEERLLGSVTQSTSQAHDCARRPPPRLPGADPRRSRQVQPRAQLLATRAAAGANTASATPCCWLCTDPRRCSWLRQPRPYRGRSSAHELAELPTALERDRP